MAWTKVTMIEEQFGDEIGLRTIGGVVIGTKANGRRKWYCESNTVVASNDALTASAGGVSVAAIGQVFSSSRPNCRCRTRNVERLTPYQFHVTANYHDPTDGSSFENLLGQPAVIRTRSENVMEPYGVDHHDPPRLVRNTAGEPYDQLPERLAAFRLYEIAKYVDSGTKANIEAALHTINNATKIIDGFAAPAGYLLLASADFEPVDDFYHATLAVKYNPNGWRDQIASFGFDYIDGGGGIFAGIRRPILVPEEDPDTGEVEWVRAAKPWPLNEDGTQITDPDGTPFTQEFYPYPANAWTGVPLS